MKIAVDAMGGDNAPEVVIEGIERARSEMPEAEFILYGDEAKVRPLVKDDTRISIVHSPTAIEMTEEPVKAIRSKKDSSLVMAAQAVKNGEADAIFSLGSTGALLAAGLFIVGRIKGIDRPGLMPTMPTTDGKGFIMLDVGANAENRVSHLVQFAVMGDFYARDLRGEKSPRVALLNNGGEANKGDTLHQEAHEALAALSSINFIGNVEAGDLLQGAADVVVTDGFTGNATLKAIEGTAKTIMRLMKHAILDSGLKAKLGGLLLKNDIKGIAETFNVASYGGAVLLGLKAPVVKAHGSADAETVYYTAKQIGAMLENDTIGKVANYFAENPISD